jgi:hypothetical protein
MARINRAARVTPRHAPVSPVRRTRWVWAGVCTVQCAWLCGRGARGCPCWLAASAATSGGIAVARGASRDFDPVMCVLTPGGGGWGDPHGDGRSVLLGEDFSAPWKWWRRRGPLASCWLFTVTDGDLIVFSGPCAWSAGCNWYECAATRLEMCHSVDMRFFFLVMRSCERSKLASSAFHF